MQDGIYARLVYKGKEYPEVGYRIDDGDSFRRIVRIFSGLQDLVLSDIERANENATISGTKEKEGTPKTG
jgi:hypothetical protein